MGKNDAKSQLDADIERARADIVEFAYMPVTRTMREFLNTTSDAQVDYETQLCEVQSCLKVLEDRFDALLHEAPGTTRESVKPDPAPLGHDRNQTAVFVGDTVENHGEQGKVSGVTPSGLFAIVNGDGWAWGNIVLISRAKPDPTPVSPCRSCAFPCKDESRMGPCERFKIKQPEPAPAPKPTWMPNIVVDPTMPEGEMELRSKYGRVRIVGLGTEKLHREQTRDHTCLACDYDCNLAGTNEDNAWVLGCLNWRRKDTEAPAHGAIRNVFEEIGRSFASPFLPAGFVSVTFPDGRPTLRIGPRDMQLEPNGEFSGSGSDMRGKWLIKLARADDSDCAACGTERDPETCGNRPCPNWTPTPVTDDQLRQDCAACHWQGVCKLVAPGVPCPKFLAIDTAPKYRTGCHDVEEFYPPDPEPDTAESRREACKQTVVTSDCICCPRKDECTEWQDAKFNDEAKRLLRECRQSIMEAAIEGHALTETQGDLLRRVDTLLEASSPKLLGVE